jgi:hypothetical protein
VSVDSHGKQCYGDPVFPNYLAISADGRFVAFDSRKFALVPGDTNMTSDVFVHDRWTGSTERVSLDSAGGQMNGGGYGPSISRDGRFVSFVGVVIPGPPVGPHMYIRDRATGTTEQVDLATSGAQADGFSESSSSIGGDGRFVAFSSVAGNLAAGDANGVSDVFVRDRSASGFTTLCEPGVGGTAVCPCANPPAGPDRGCDNSSATGGARLSATGIAYLSQDSLVFATRGETGSALSVLLQGDARIPNGVLEGQGVRCAGGSTLRLYVKHASAGSIRAPDFPNGEATVSARSAALGSVIQPGESRWYLVLYRDPTVLGGCPATSTFNATQTGRVDWSL